MCLRMFNSNNLRAAHNRLINGEKLGTNRIYLRLETLFHKPYYVCVMCLWQFELIFPHFCPNIFSSFPATCWGSRREYVLRAETFFVTLQHKPISMIWNHPPKNVFLLLDVCSYIACHIPHYRRQRKTCEIAARS